ncbi:MAG: hypothetical protein ACRBCL_11675 [Maritimibacter sp.]
MSEISELQTRLAAALDRIGAGVEGLAKPVAAPPVDTTEVDQLKQQLEEERTANAQLEERVRAIKNTQDETLEKLQSEVERLRGMLASEEGRTQKLARVNADLRANNAAMREAIEAGVAEPHLVNKAMMAELEALRATQSADRAELDAVLDEIGSLIEQAEAPAIAPKAAPQEEPANA